MENDCPKARRIVERKIATKSKFYNYVGSQTDFSELLEEPPRKSNYNLT